jgi:predicted Zn-dependent protease
MVARCLFGRSARLALIAGTLASLAACTVNPATGQRQFNVISRSQEVALGTEAQPQLTTEYGGEIPSASIKSYVRTLGQNLAQHTEADFPSLPWEFTVLNSEVINAFALPGGKVFISRGLMEKMTNEAQLAAVLGHEIGHVTARHANDGIFRQTIAGLGTKVAEAAVGAEVANAVDTAGNLIVLRYSRNQELQADALGMRYMTKAMYNPKGVRQVMEILKAAAGGSGGGLDTFFSSHPDPDARIQQADRLVASEYAFTQSDARYKLNEAEFRANFLSKLSALPPATPGPSSVARLPDGRFDLRNTASWCGVCAAQQNSPQNSTQNSTQASAHTHAVPRTLAAR